MRDCCSIGILNSALHNNLAMQEKTRNDVSASNGPEEFSCEAEIGLGSEIVSEDASLEKRLSSVREGLLDVLNMEYPLFSAEELKEIESMVSSLEECIAHVSEDIDRNKEIQEVKESAEDDDHDIDFASDGGFLGGDKSKNEGLLDINPDDFVSEDNYEPDSLPSPTFASPVRKESGKTYWEQIHPYELDAHIAVLEYHRKFNPSSFNRVMQYIPEDYEPEYVPDSLPSPTYASPAQKSGRPSSFSYMMQDILVGPESMGYEPEDQEPVPYEPEDQESVEYEPEDQESVDYEPEDYECVDYEPFAVSSPKMDNLRVNNVGYASPLNSGPDPESCKKRKEVDEWNSESPAPKAKRPRTELDSRFTDVPRVMASRGGWLEEWVMSGTAGWLDD